MAAVAWKHGHPFDPGGFGGLSATAHAVNDRGAIVGEAFMRGGWPLAFIWEPPSGARAVLHRGLQEASTSRSRYIEARHLLLALLSRERPDPAAELLAALGVDPAQVRARLTGPPA